MISLPVREARSRFSSILKEAEHGASIDITRNGVIVARLVPPEPIKKALPQLDDFRASINLKGSPLSEHIVRLRDDERY